MRPFLPLSDTPWGTSALSFRSILRASLALASTTLRAMSPRAVALRRKRGVADRLLDKLGRGTSGPFEGTVLVDGMWDNPNFWLRYSLLRAALGLHNGRELAVLGAFRRPEVRRTLRALGIPVRWTFPRIPTSTQADDLADRLVAKTRTADDVLTWKLPGDVHPAIVYDGILKRQRLPSLDVYHPEFRNHVREAVRAIERSATMLGEEKIDLVVISHPLNFHWGSLAWQALSNGIPVVLVFGLFGVLRFMRMEVPTDLFRFYDRPTREEIDQLPSDQAAAMSEIGIRYLAGRLEGRADDLASVFAFQKNQESLSRTEICRCFGWDPAKPIVGFYASNWFDWPHQLGMTQFRDFLDWTEASFSAAAKNTSVNWLFKPHPAEGWFGGIGLANLLSRFGSVPHIGLVPKGWNNTAVMSAIDALVTYHGTAGVEFAGLGKPVLVPDRGKYDDCGFVLVAQSRADYLDLLSRSWWDTIDLVDAKRRAAVFAGWWFCAPKWQGNFILGDDSRQDILYDDIPKLVAGSGAVIAKELDELAAWWASGHSYYHTTKMARTQSYQLSNLAAR